MQRIFHDEKYGKLAEALREPYACAEPFPHCVIDDFLPAKACRGLVDEFPGEHDIDWIRFSDSRGVKLASRDENQFKPHTYQLFQQFNSGALLSFLESLTGIRGLIADPYFVGGGIHQIGRGGFLKIHADFNRHDKLLLDRRINLLLFLNPDWKDEFGGHLELWDADMTGCVQKIAPIMNRCVIFNTTDSAYHGHPDPLACPPEMTRKSLALYYYTNGRPENEYSDGHSTMYQYRPEEQKHTGSLGYRSRRLLADVLDKTASLTEKPGSLLHAIANRVRPPQY